MKKRAIMFNEDQPEEVMTEIQIFEHEVEAVVILIKETFSQNSDSYHWICNGNGHDTKDCRNKCKICRNANHTYKDCLYEEDTENNKANNSEEQEKSHAFYSSLNSQQNYQNNWYVDSGSHVQE